MSLLFLVIAFIFFFLISAPIAVAIGLASLPVVIDAGMPIMYIGQRLFASLDSFTLLAIPFFILAGTIMEGGGISRRLIDFANTCVGNRYGGLAIVTIVASMFFAAVSGSGSATTAAIGAIMIPAMVNKKYDIRFASATTATAAQIGVIIPPSIPMVLYCVGTNNSIGTMFIAGIVPGILIGISLILYAGRTSKKLGYVGDRKYTGAEKWTAFKKAIWALLMPVIILGGIYSGVFTPTESAAIACAYALVVALFVYREITFKQLFQIFLKSSITTAVVMIILSTAGLFASVLTYEKVPQLVADAFLSLGGNKYVFLIIINILLFFVGMFFDGGPAMIILAPILAPVAVSLGIDPIHFGIIMVCNSALGQITPPFGVNLFVASQVANIKMESMIKNLLPYMAIVVIDVLLISYLPIISIGLPKLFGMM
ncbi:TRAP transporter large permease [Cuneatibacter sp. NSJ-177]|uniref:TRAP transporter large permease n=1 Tax=Cuneatibacter sp. NSJ-177 TaxID=2931401 RepID=UPI001FD40D3B|nr:TRAP transporter large permease [Cuneatibacter sp. NSJ-177]MCJ7835291.1 TRAP transporter large permease [Cuneatibacter sp. NSJ-177]